MTREYLEHYQRIWQTVKAIPHGQVATYGQIAAHAGLPRGARLVGQALKNLPREHRVPWHRVINAQGKLSFPPDSRQYTMQRRKLEAEGIIFIKDKIDLKRCGWRGNLDALLWHA